MFTQVMKDAKFCCTIALLGLACRYVTESAGCHKQSLFQAVGFRRRMCMPLLQSSLPPSFSTLPSLAYLNQPCCMPLWATKTQHTRCAHPCHPLLTMAPKCFVAAALPTLAQAALCGQRWLRTGSSDSPGWWCWEVTGPLTHPHRKLVCLSELCFVHCP